MDRAEGLDAHQKPPDHMRALFKKYQKCTNDELNDDPEVLDFSNLASCRSKVRRSGEMESSRLQRAFEDFVYSPSSQRPVERYDGSSSGRSRYEVKAAPGLFVLPSLLPPAVQQELLNRLLHRDLSNTEHKTNLHLHYDVQYDFSEPTIPLSQGERCHSFFAERPGQTMTPKDLSVHKALSLQQLLDRKLRWITLGGQYDWTAKAYPAEKPPVFPPDIARLLAQLFPELDPQAAIVNLYTPGDTLSVHRDVSEECDRALASISVGCDGIFIVSTDESKQSAVVRLRSGDAILMSNAARFAWHAVPRVLAETCPSWLQNWPAHPSLSLENFDFWKGFMLRKRINLNVRQMTDRSSNSLSANLG